MLVAAGPVNPHYPRRPTWGCTACAEPWPCETQRAELAREYAADRISLTIYLAGCFSEASADLSSVDAGILYQRFLGWVGR